MILRSVLVFSLALAACSHDRKSEPNPAPNAASTSAPAKTAPGVQDVVAAIDAVMVPYEQCRALLAADAAEGVADCAAAVAAAAGEATVSDEAKPHLAAVAAAATALASTPADDLAAVRLAFGDMSQSVVAMLTVNPTAAAKYHVFECPMAAGYQRWAQSSGELANPYMGAKMLACGSEVHDL